MTFDPQKTANIQAALSEIANILDESGFVAKAAYARAALAEIERLQKDNANLLDALLGGGARIIINNAEQAKRIAELEGAAKADDGRLIAAAKKAGIEYFGCDTPDHLADRVAELNTAAMNGNELVQSLLANCNSLRSRLWKYEGQVVRQRAALKILGKRSGERGKALVEERASHLLCHDSPCDAEDGDSGDCAEADHQCCWEICTKKEEKRQIARQQLRQEGLL